MFRCLIISPDPKTAVELCQMLASIPQLEIVRTLDFYPSPDELFRSIRLRQANLCFLDIRDLSKAKTLAASIDETMPGFPVVSFGELSSAQLLPELMQLGIREMLTRVDDSKGLSGVLERVGRRLERRPLDAVHLPDLFSFLPAVPGVGASTIALSASCALAENLNVRTMLMDCDLSAGTVQFLLKLGNSASILDALTHADNLDEDLWSQMAAKWGHLEVLHSGEHLLPSAIDFSGLERLLIMARSQYEVICADLASSIDPFSIALMRQSRKIFLVTTPEVVSLHMASTRFARLNDLGLSDRVSVLLSRQVSSDLGSREVEEAVGAPVAFCFPNDYASVQNSILSAAPVSSKSDLGRSVLELAHFMAPYASEQKTPAARRKFLEYFHIRRREDSDVVWKD